MKNKFPQPLAAILCVISFGTPAWSHAHLESTEPHDGDHLQAVPPNVSIRFGSAVESSVSSIAVTDGKNQAVQMGPLNLSADGETLSSQPVGPLQQGNYLVRWNALSRDGHPVSGEFTFSVSK